MPAYYNEFDPYAAAWLRNLIAAGHIAPGDVDERSMTIRFSPIVTRSCSSMPCTNGNECALSNVRCQWPDCRRPSIYEAPRDPAIPLRIRGVGRVADEPRALLLTLNERPTDDEIRVLHDHLRGVVIA